VDGLAPPFVLSFVVLSFRSVASACERWLDDFPSMLPESTLRTLRTNAPHTPYTTDACACVASNGNREQLFSHSHLGRSTSLRWGKVCPPTPVVPPHHTTVPGARRRRSMTLPSAIVRRGSIFLPSWDTISSIIALGGQMLHVLPAPPRYQNDIRYESCATLTALTEQRKAPLVLDKFFRFN